jgi:hypothetical protein
MKDKETIMLLLDKAGIPFSTSGLTGNSLYLSDVEIHFHGNDDLACIYSIGDEGEEF